MSTTAAPTEARGALERMKPTALLGYGLGDFGCNLAFALSTSFLLFYYTDVAGLSAAAIGTMFFVVRIASLLPARQVRVADSQWTGRGYALFRAGAKAGERLTSWLADEWTSRPATPRARPR